MKQEWCRCLLTMCQYRELNYDKGKTGWLGDWSNRSVMTFNNTKYEVGTPAQHSRLLSSVYQIGFWCPQGEDKITYFLSMNRHQNYISWWWQRNHDRNILPEKSVSCWAKRHPKHQEQTASAPLPLAETPLLWFGAGPCTLAEEDKGALLAEAERWDKNIMGQKDFQLQRQRAKFPESALCSPLSVAKSP